MNQVHPKEMYFCLQTGEIKTGEQWMRVPGWKTLDLVPVKKTIRRIK